MSDLRRVKTPDAPVQRSVRRPTLEVPYGWVSVTYFVQWLNDRLQSVLPEIHSWIDAGVLRVVKEVDGRLYFTRAHAEHFTRTYTYPVQAAAVLNVGEQDVLDLIAQGRLPTVPCVRAPVYHRYLLVRVDVERLSV